MESSIEDYLLSTFSPSYSNPHYSHLNPNFNLNPNISHNPNTNSRTYSSTDPDLNLNAYLNLTSTLGLALLNKTIL